MPLRRHASLAACALAFVAALPAQQKLQHGAVHAIAVPLGADRAGRAHGFTPSFYLDQARYPLVLVVGDRGSSASAMMRALPSAVIDRKRMILVAPELVNADYEPANFARLQQLVGATADAALRTWSTDDKRVVLLGIGRGATRALAIARADRDRYRAVVALDPDDAWVPADGATAELPALVVSPGGKTRKVADELRDRFGNTLPIAISERREVATGQGELLLQPALEWLHAQLVPPPKDDKDRIHGRTAAASGSKSRVVAIAGEYDHVENVLEVLAIPHVVLQWPDLVAFDLADTDVVLINCSAGEAYGAVRAKVNKKLRQFATGGGYLFATDWALRWPLAEVFPDWIGDLDPGTEEHMVDVRPTARSTNHELLQNVFPLDLPMPRWQIDPASFLVKVADQKRLDVLLESDELGKLYDGNRMLGVTFRVGAYGGLVMNVVSHFSHQGDGTPTTPMYQLIVNFINAAKTQRASRR